MVAILVDGMPRKTKLLVIWRRCWIFALCQLSSIYKLRSAVAEETLVNVWAAYQKQERPSLLTNRQPPLKRDLLAHFLLKCYTVWVLQQVYRAKDILFIKAHNRQVALAIVGQQTYSWQVYVYLKRWRHKHFKKIVLFGFLKISENLSKYYVFSPKLRCYS